jgi:hypothetical protein
MTILNVNQITTNVHKHSKNCLCLSKNLKFIGSLGIITKTQASPINTSFKGISRASDYELQERAGELLPNERVSKCLKHRVNKARNRSVVYIPKTDKLHWDNVHKCGSVFSCKICSKQVSEKRRQELKIASEKWKKQGNTLLLLTLTHSHTISDNLKDLISKQKKALTYFFGWFKGKELFNSVNKFGHITANEDTYGDNGFHPHKHILLFCGGDVSFKLQHCFKLKLFNHWLKCCERAGLSLPSNKHGLDIRNGDYASKYISKWGIEEEMTKSITKCGKSGSYTPFDLLNLSIKHNDYLINGRTPACLFKEYFSARKGTRQLSWSRGLKSYFGISEKNDDDIVKEAINDAVTLLEVDNRTFYLIKRAKLREKVLQWLRHDLEQGILGDGLYQKNINNLLKNNQHYISEYRYIYH